MSSIGNRSINEGQIVTINLSASDPDGDTLIYGLSGSTGGFVTLTDAGDGTATLRLAPGYDRAGSYAISISVGDGNGGLDVENLTITVANVVQDADADGVEDFEDNCPANANAGQEDMDGDGIGKACDRNFYINFGAAGSINDSAGNNWMVGTVTASSGSINIVNTTTYTGVTNPAVCSTVAQARSGTNGRDLNFSIGGMPSGTYTFKIYFMETESTSSRRGEFDIDVEGTRKVNNFSPQDEGLRVAHTVTLSHSVTDGTINLQLDREGGIPSLCAVEITRN
jgi:hypothetical protein